MTGDNHARYRLIISDVSSSCGIQLFTAEVQDDTGKPVISAQGVTKDAARNLLIEKLRRMVQSSTAMLSVVEHGE